MNAVTPPPIRYMFVCIGCNQLKTAFRRDRLTCSPACRVRAHRDGSAKAIRDTARSFDVPPALLVRAQAVRTLRPDLAEQINAGTRTLIDVEPDMWATLCERLATQFPEEWEEYRSNGWKLFPTGAAHD